VKSAIINAENPPNERQSRDVLGLKKLKVKMIKMKELIKTTVHKPYPLVMLSIKALLS